ncbi:hypothetical protein ACHAWF_008176 [Thalassiosira exigua]
MAGGDEFSDDVEDGTGGGGDKPAWRHASVGENPGPAPPRERPEKFFQLFTGLREDLAARAPYYRSDWGKPRSLLRVFNATIFAFVVQLIPALIFADLMEKKTKGNLAVAETLLSAAIIGIIYAIISGQPLTLLGITGPVAILLGTSYGLAAQFDSDYFPFFWWVCMWTAIMHFLTAVTGIVNFVWHISPFTTQIFEFFIGSSFIYESIRDLVEPLHLGDANYEGNRAPQYVSLVIGMLAFGLCWKLHFAETWVLLSRQMRTFLASYNMAIVVIIVTALSYLPGANLEGIERVHVIAPWNWQPSVNDAGETRHWVVSPSQGVSAKGIAGALFPAFMIYLLFFIDHNISSILTQAPKFDLKKPTAYHWDFFCLGLTIIPCAILGLPPGSGLIPQAPLHTRALSERKFVEDNGIKREITTHVEEQRWSALFQASLMFVALSLFTRWSALFQASLMFVALSLFTVISWIPVGALFGVFLYLGVGAMHGNEIFHRITLSFMYAKRRPEIPVVTNVKWGKVQLYTLIQVCCAGAIFGVAQFASLGEFHLAKMTCVAGDFGKGHLAYNLYSPGFIFPALVAALVPVRSYLVPCIFSDEDLQFLDPMDETEEQAHEEKVACMMRTSSLFESGMRPPAFSDFHASGIKKGIESNKRRASQVKFSMSASVAEEEPNDSTLVRRHQAASQE